MKLRKNIRLRYFRKSKYNADNKPPPRYSYAIILAACEGAATHQIFTKII